MFRRKRRWQGNPNQPRPVRSVSDECGEAQCSRGEEIISAGGGRVGVDVRGGVRPGNRAQSSRRGPSTRLGW